MGDPPAWSLEEGSIMPQNEHYRCADKSLTRPEEKEATATEDFDVHISYL